MGIIDDYTDDELAQGSQLSHKEDATLAKRVEKMLELCGEFLDNKKAYAKSMVEKIPIRQLELDFFLRQMSTFSSHLGYDAIGEFIGYLVQHSFNQGENSFSLDFTSYENSFPLNDLGRELKVKQDSLLDLKIHGDVGWFAFFKAEYVRAHIYNPVEIQFGISANNCTFYLHNSNDTLIDAGGWSRRCDWHIASKSMLNGINARPFDGNNYYLINQDGSSTQLYMDDI